MAGEGGSEWSQARNKLFISFGLMGLGLIFALAYMLGQTAVDKTQQDLQQTLVLVRQKFVTCQRARETLRQKTQRAASITGTAAYKLQQQNEVLSEKNDELMYENDDLREEKRVIEQTISELRYEVDMKHEINAREKQQLEDYQNTGNMSAGMMNFLTVQQKWGSVDKDDFIAKLISELKAKKQQLQKCHLLPASKPVPSPQSPQPTRDADATPIDAAPIDALVAPEAAPSAP